VDPMSGRRRTQAAAKPAGGVGGETGKSEGSETQMEAEWREV
jgi:hypothetical protein